MKRVENYAAVDIGAGSGRVFLGTLRDCRIEMREIHRFCHEIVHENGFMKWDWLRITREVFSGLEKTFAELNGEKLSSISCDSWAQDFGLLDKNGKLIFSPVSYRDTRTNGIPEQIAKLVSPESFLRRNGSALAPMTSLCQLKAMSIPNPEILKNTSSLLHIADLLNFELCGVAASDWTVATVSQLWNIKNDDWDFELLDKLDIPSHFLPKVFSKPEKIGVIRSGPLQETPVVSTAGHDTAAASAVLYPLRKGTLSLSLGSWAMLGCSIEEDFNPADYPYHPGLSFFGLPYGKWGAFKSLQGLWSLQQCRKEWGTVGWDELTRSAGLSRIDSIINLEDKSLFVPGKMTEEIAELCRKTGQVLPETPGDYMRVICQSLARIIAEGIRELAEFSKFSFGTLHIMSGGSLNSFLCNEIGAASGLKIIRGPAEASAAGNLLLQAIASDAVKSDEEIKSVASGFFI